jgi:hypothetical protein
MSEERQGEKEAKAGRTLPDTVFKKVTGEMAVAAGLDLLNVELPRLPSTDLILYVPEGKDLSATPFDFLFPYSIIEFKSENDTFDEYELSIGLGRSHIFYNRFRKAKYKEILTVYVCARRPDDVIDHLEAEEIGIIGDPEIDWLVRAKIGMLNVAFIICRNLPLEEKYYKWLIFASSKSAKWKFFVKMMLRTKNYEVIKLLGYFRFKELLNMITELKEEAKTSPEAPDQELIEIWDKFASLYVDDPEGFARLLSGFKTEFIVNALKAEQLDEFAKLVQKRKKQLKSKNQN